MPQVKTQLLLLGTPQLLNGGERITFDTRKALALLAYLVVTGQNQSRDTLAALLWSDQDQISARGALRRTLSTLLKGLDDGLLSVSRETIGLATPSEKPSLEADITGFNRDISAARRHLVKAADLAGEVLGWLEQAVALWQGEFMQGFSLRDAPEFEEWQSQTAENLRRDLVWALEKLVAGHLATGQLETALENARRWLSFDPLNEAAHRQTMQILAWQGQTGRALRQYQECARVLERELGVPPLEATTNLYQAIKEQRFEPFKPALLPPVPSTTVSPELAAILKMPLVGREGEKELLDQTVRQVLTSRHGHLVVVEGEPGIGKTRLVEEFLAVQPHTDRRVTTVTCYEGETEMAFLSISAALQKSYQSLGQAGQARWLEKIPAEWRREAARLYADLGQGLPAAGPLDIPGAQGQFYEALRQTLLSLVQPDSPVGSPGFIFFDDLQWIDGASLDFLSYLVNRLADQPLCLVLAWRIGTPELKPPLAKLLNFASKAALLTRLNPTRLSQDQVKMLLASSLPGRPEMTALLYSETEGLPLFVVEYLKAYQSGALESNLGLKNGAGLAAWPVGVLNLLESRLHSLSEPTQQLLHSAAVIGRSFDFDNLREVSGRSEDETIAGLEELTRASIVNDETSTSHELRYDFRHEKLRSFVYGKTSLARRRLLHRRAAEALAKPRAGSIKEQLLAQAGYHYRQAGEDSRAASFYKLAGDYARSLYANREAIIHYQEALTLGHPESSWLHEALGDLYTLLGEYTPALHRYLLAGSPDEPTARLEYKVGKVYLWRGDWQLAISQFEMVRKLTGLDPNLEAQLYTDWGLALHRLDRDEEARQLAEKALSEATRYQNLEAQARSFNFLGLLAGHRRETTQATEYLRTSLTLSEKLGDPSLQAAALNNLAWVSRANHAYERAIALTDAALAIVKNQGDRHRQAALLSNLGDLYQETGQPDKARDFVKQSIMIYAEIGIEAGTFQPGIWLLTEW